MKLPDRLIAKWIIRHPRVDAWLDRHLDVYSIRVTRIFCFAFAMSSIAYYLNWKLIRTMSVRLIFILIPVWILLELLCYLKHDMNHDRPQIMRDMEQDHAHS